MDTDTHSKKIVTINLAGGRLNGREMTTLSS